MVLNLIWRCENEQFSEIGWYHDCMIHKLLRNIFSVKIFVGKKNILTVHDHMEPVPTYVEYNLVGCIKQICRHL